MQKEVLDCVGIADRRAGSHVHRVMPEKGAGPSSGSGPGPGSGCTRSGPGPRPMKLDVPAFMTERVYFDFDKSVLKLEAQALLKKKAEWLKANPSATLLIEGHCDERGTAEYNLALGERRAEAAKKFLVDLGIDAKRMTTISYGEERPVDPRHSEEAWAKNRHADFVIN